MKILSHLQALNHNLEPIAQQTRVVNVAVYLARKISFIIGSYLLISTALLGAVTETQSK